MVKMALGASCLAMIFGGQARYEVTTPPSSLRGACPKLRASTNKKCVCLNLTRLSPILVDAHGGRLESCQSFKENSLHLTYSKRTPADVVHAVQGVLRAG